MNASLHSNACSFIIDKSYCSQNSAYAIVARQFYPTQWEIDLVKKGTLQPRVSIKNLSSVLQTQQLALALDGLRRWALKSVDSKRATLSFCPEDPRTANTPSEVAKWLVCLSEEHELVGPLVKKAEDFIENFLTCPSEENLFFISPLIVCEGFATDIINGYCTLCKQTSQDAFFVRLASTIRQISKPMAEELISLVVFTGLCEAHTRIRFTVFAAILDHFVDFGLPCSFIPSIQTSLERRSNTLGRDAIYWMEHCTAAIAYLYGDPPSWYTHVRELETRVLLKCYFEAEEIALAATNWLILHRARELFLHAESYTNDLFIDWLEIAPIRMFEQQLPKEVDDEENFFMEKYTSN